MLITPFIVKNAASSRERSPGRTRRCSQSSSTATTAAPTVSQLAPPRAPTTAGCVRAPWATQTSSSTVARWSPRATQIARRWPSAAGTERSPRSRSNCSSCSA
jgi:hypothetical protein